jgi:hypothetical protein
LALLALTAPQPGRLRGRFTMIRSAVLMTILFFVIACQPAHGDILGFGNGSGYTLNSNISSSAPSINSGTLTLTTNGVPNQASSAFFNTRQSTGSFTAVFTYQGSGTADGVTFIIQNDPHGLNALGSLGSGLGYAATGGNPQIIVNSVGLQIDLYTFTGNGSTGTYLGTQGSSGIFNYLSSLPVNFSTGDPIQFTVTYDANAQTLREVLVDAVATTTYSHTFTGINIASQVGGNSAYVGFAGGTGGLSSTQTISGFQFQSAAQTAVPEPSSLTLLGLGCAALAGWRWRRRNAGEGRPGLALTGGKGHR